MRSLLLASLLTTALFSNELFNTDLLTMRGIDPKILNTTISNTRQSVAFRMKVEHHLLSKGKKSDLNYYIVIDPYPSYGTEMQIQMSKKDLEDLDTSDIKRTLDEMMGVQLYVQHSTLYDISTFKLEKDDADETIVSFRFNNEVLPRELKHFKGLQGYVHIVDGKLQKIDIIGNKRFKLRGVEVESYRKSIYYKPVKTGGYLIAKEELDYKGVYDGLPYSETLVANITEYWSANRHLITFEEGVSDQPVNIVEKGYKTIAIDLDRTFPLLGKEARKAGYDLPKPYGITFINMFQDTNMHMTSFEIDGWDVDLNKILDGDSTYRSLTYAPLIRADLWVLPFVSFSLILGGTDTNTDVRLVSDSGLSIPNPILPGVLPPVTVIPAGGTLNGSLHTNSVLYGVGATVAGGFDNYFTTIDFQYMIAYTPSKEVTIDMMIITPLVGYTFRDYNTRLFIGAQYQRLAQEITFALDFNDQNGQPRSLSGKIGLRSDEWAGVVGVDYSFTRQWSSNLMYSEGVDRRNAVLGITYRF